MRGKYIVSFSGKNLLGKSSFYTLQTALEFARELEDCSYVIFDIRHKKMVEQSINYTHTNIKQLEQMFMELQDIT